MSRQEPARPTFGGPGWADRGAHAFALMVGLYAIVAVLYCWLLVPRLGRTGGMICGLFFSVFAAILVGTVLGQLGLFSTREERASPTSAGVGTGLVLFVVSHLFLAGVLYAEKNAWRWEDAKAQAARLHTAARDGDLEWVAKLLDAGVSPDAPDVFGTPPILTTRDGGAATLLLSRGANPRVTDGSGETPLMKAALEGELAYARALVAAGAPLETKRPGWDDTALDLAIWTQHEDVAQLLREAGARDVTVTAANGTPLPADGGAPMAAVSAYLDAIEKRDAARFRQACGPRPESFFANLDLASWLSHPAEPRFVSGFANESAATLVVAGTRRDGRAVTIRVQLARNGTGAFKVLRDWSLEPAAPR